MSDAPHPDDEKIGPGRPPKKHRWVRGGPSPNPKGRPRKKEDTLPALKKIFEDCLHKPIRLSRDDKLVHLSRFEIGMERLVSDFAKGDARSRRELLHWAQALGVDLKGAGNKIEEALSPSHATILEEYIKRRTVGEEERRVIAPADLRDDDPGESR